jgi:hypothetical protein
MILSILIGMNLILSQNAFLGIFNGFVMILAIVTGGQIECDNVIQIQSENVITMNLRMSSGRSGQGSLFPLETLRKPWKPSEIRTFSPKRTP